MKKLSLLGLAALTVLAAPVASLAQSGWSSAGSCSASINLDPACFWVNPFPNNACLTFRAGRFGRFTARYNVTNTAVPSTPAPPWATFEFGYVDPGAGAGATAILYEINPCVPNPVEICRVVSVDNQFCGVCQFEAGTFNFLTNLYFVEVTLNRSNAEAPVPQACTLRIF